MSDPQTTTESIATVPNDPDRPRQFQGKAVAAAIFVALSRSVYEEKSEYGIEGCNYLRRHRDCVSSHHPHSDTQNPNQPRSEIGLHEFRLAHPDTNGECTTRQYVHTEQHHHEREANIGDKITSINDSPQRASTFER